MFINLLGSSTKKNLTIFSNSLRLYMVSNKHQEHGMRDWVPFWKKMVFQEDRFRNQFSDDQFNLICWFFKSMLMISSLAQQMKTYVRNILTLYIMNLKWAWWEKLIFFLACKSSNKLMKFSPVKKNISKIYLRNSNEWSKYHEYSHAPIL